MPTGIGARTLRRIFSEQPVDSPEVTTIMQLIANRGIDAKNVSDWSEAVIGQFIDPKAKDGPKNMLDAEHVRTTFIAAVTAEIEHRSPGASFTSRALSGAAQDKALRALRELLRQLLERYPQAAKKKDVPPSEPRDSASSAEDTSQVDRSERALRV